MLAPPCSHYPSSFPCFSYTRSTLATLAAFLPLPTLPTLPTLFASPTLSDPPALWLSWLLCFLLCLLSCSSCSSGILQGSSSSLLRFLPFPPFLSGFRSAFFLPQVRSTHGWCWLSWGTWGTEIQHASSAALFLFPFPPSPLPFSLPPLPQSVILMTDAGWLGQHVPLACSRYSLFSLLFLLSLPSFLFSLFSDSPAYSPALPALPAFPFFYKVPFLLSSTLYFSTAFAFFSFCSLLPISRHFVLVSIPPLCRPFSFSPFPAPLYHVGNPFFLGSRNDTGRKSLAMQTLRTSPHMQAEKVRVQPR